MTDADDCMAHLALVGEHRIHVRELQGFRKGHRVPTEASPQAAAFIARIAADDLGKDLDERFSEFRRRFRFRRVDLQVREPENGSARISTPWFDYCVSVSLDPTDVTQAVWRRRLSRIPDPQLLLSSEVASVFGQLFDTVELAPRTPIDVESLIDHVEHSSDQSLTIDYDRQLTWCEFVISDIPARLTVRSDQLSLTTLQPDVPARLVESFCAMRQRLTWIQDLDHMVSPE